MRGALCDILTLVDDGDSVSVVYQRRQSAQIVLIGQFFVRDLDEADSQRVGLVVDVLEFLQCFIRFSALWLICNGISVSQTILLGHCATLTTRHSCVEEK
jgi:hypothetical protein